MELLIGHGICRGAISSVLGILCIEQLTVCVEQGAWSTAHGANSAWANPQSSVHGAVSGVHKVVAMEQSAVLGMICIEQLARCASNRSMGRTALGVQGAKRMAQCAWSRNTQSGECAWSC
jgi:hypothetical protein